MALSSTDGLREVDAALDSPGCIRPSRRVIASGFVQRRALDRRDHPRGPHCVATLLHRDLGANARIFPASLRAWAAA